MFCRKCGSEVGNEDRFCRKCGQNVDSSVEPYSPVVLKDPSVSSMYPMRRGVGNFLSRHNIGKKKIIIGIIALVSIIFILNNIKYMTATKSPENVSKAFINAIAKEDKKLLLACFERDNMFYRETGGYPFTTYEMEDMDDLLETANRKLKFYYGDDWHKKVKIDLRGSSTYAGLSYANLKLDIYNKGTLEIAEDGRKYYLKPGTAYDVLVRLSNTSR